MQKKKELLKSKLHLLSGADFSGARTYPTEDFPVKSFGDFNSYARTLNDPDAVRTALYCAFQPLYSTLLAESLPNPERETAVKLLNTLTDTGIRFLTAYYTGSPGIPIFATWLDSSAESFQMLRNVRYVKDDRLMDYPGIIKPADVSKFLKATLQYSLDALQEGSPVAEYVVGCACGSSEIAMPLAGILECGLGFLKFSKNRNKKKEVLSVKEHEPAIAAGVKGKNVLCVEDRVDTGETLFRVMKLVEDYGASQVRGASVARCDSEMKHPDKVSGPGFYAFSLPKEAPRPWQHG